VINQTSFLKGSYFSAFATLGAVAGVIRELVTATRAGADGLRFLAFAKKEDKDCQQ